MTKHLVSQSLIQVQDPERDKRKKQKLPTFLSRAAVKRRISTKLCMKIGDDRTIFASPDFFNRTSSFGARVSENFKGNAPSRFWPINSYFTNRIAPNVNNFHRPNTRINPTDFTNIGQGVKLALLAIFRFFFGGGGGRNPQISTTP